MPVSLQRAINRQTSRQATADRRAARHLARQTWVYISVKVHPTLSQAIRDAKDAGVAPSCGDAFRSAVDAYLRLTDAERRAARYEAGPVNGAWVTWRIGIASTSWTAFRQLARRDGNTIQAAVACALRVFLVTGGWV